MSWGLRDIEQASLRAFVEGCSSEFTNSVLDYGCGQQPYRDVVEDAGGVYVPFDRASFPANKSAADVGSSPQGHYGAVLCTQVIQYWDEPATELEWLRLLLASGGALVLTGPTNWPVIEDADLRRYTPEGIRHLLADTGYRDVEITPRAGVVHQGEAWLLGWGAVARA